VKNVALITGGCQGLGFALAEEFASHGFNLFLVSNDAPRLREAKKYLQEKYKSEIVLLAQDLKEKDAAKSIYAFAQDNDIEVTALANNAGAALYGAFAEAYFEDNANIIKVDIAAVVDLTHLFLREMIARHNGYLLNIASTAAFQPGPNVAIYYAAKSFILSFSQALSEELKDSGVKVSCFCPGLLKTGMLETSGISQSNIMTTFKPIEPRKAAKIAYEGLLRNKLVVVPGAKNRWRAFLPRVFPRKIVLRLMSGITSPRPKKTKD
jgi:short-subunit dehydrogenase